MNGKRTGRTAWMSGAAAGLAVAALGPGAAPAPAQSLAEEVERAPAGDVRFEFPARPGVWGDGRSWHIGDPDDGRWRCDCENGPVRVLLERRGREIADVEVRVGGRWRHAGAATDLGPVPAAEAAEYLLGLARTLPGDGAEGALAAASVADGVEVWPELLAIARDDSRPGDVRESAVFWVAHAAGEAVVADLEAFVEADDEDLEVRESAVFALSQLDGDRGVEALLRVARENRDPRITRTALFWLGQSEDPRALALFEEILSQ